MESTSMTNHEFQQRIDGAREVIARVRRSEDKAARLGHPTKSAAYADVRMGMEQVLSIFISEDISPREQIDDPTPPPTEPAKGGEGAKVNEHAKWLRKEAADWERELSDYPRDRKVMTKYLRAAADEITRLERERDEWRARTNFQAQAHVGWKERADRLAAELAEAKVLLQGSETRAGMVFDSKNHWADRARVAESKLAEARNEVAKHLSPGNANAGDLIASIRDLAQAKVSNQGNVEALEAKLAEVTAFLSNSNGALYEAENRIAVLERECAALRKAPIHAAKVSVLRDQELDDCRNDFTAVLAREAGLREALEPFAKLVADIPDFCPGDERNSYTPIALPADYRRARAALSESPEGVAEAIAKWPHVEFRYMYGDEGASPVIVDGHTGPHSGPAEQDCARLGGRCALDRAMEVASK